VAGVVVLLVIAGIFGRNPPQRDEAAQTRASAEPSEAPNPAPVVPNAEESATNPGEGSDALKTAAHVAYCKFLKKPVVHLSDPGARR
jgi:hypothetical protein